MSKTYSEYLLEGAQKLLSVGFGFAVREGKWDATFWQLSGDQQKGAEVLELVPGTNPTDAVEQIFSNPGDWSFDCSQFCQVLLFYAEMKILNDTHPDGFDLTFTGGSKQLEIKPFLGADFTRREHYYRREQQSHWMKYRAKDSGPYAQTKIPAWDLVKAAPIGSRINFHVGAGGAFQFENTVKLSDSPLQFAAHGFNGQNVFDHNDMMIRLGQVRDASVNTFAEASQYVWIKEVAIFEEMIVLPHEGF